MADTAVGSLTALTGANVTQTTDALLIVDTSATATKKILVSELALAMNVLMTEQATTSGTSFDFTIPTWATRVTIMLAGVSTNGTSGLIVQLGDSGGIETSSYTGALVTQAGTVVTLSTGFNFINGTSAGNVLEGIMELSMQDFSGFTWIAQSICGTSQSNIAVHSMTGRKSTSAAMTTVRLTTVNGTDTFDAGAVNVLYR